jgi:methyl coenzyme M reductase subunit C
LGFVRWWVCKWEQVVECRYGMGYKKGGNVLEKRRKKGLLEAG